MLPNRWQNIARRASTAHTEQKITTFSSDSVQYSRERDREREHWRRNCGCDGWHTVSEDVFVNCWWHCTFTAIHQIILFYCSFVFQLKLHLHKFTIQISIWSCWSCHANSRCSLFFLGILLYVRIYMRCSICHPYDDDDDDDNTTPTTMKFTKKCWKCGNV